MTAPLMFASVCLSFSGLWVWVCWRVWAFPHRVHSSFINLHQEGHMGLSREDHWGRDGWKDVTSFSPNPRNRADRRKSNPPCKFLFSLMVEMYLKTWITLWRQGKGGRREAWRKLLWADSPHKHTHSLHARTWTETDSLLKLMNWQLDTQLLGVSILTAHPVWNQPWVMNWESQHW